MSRLFYATITAVCLLLCGKNAYAQMPFSLGDTENEQESTMMADGLGGVFVTGGLISLAVDFDPGEGVLSPDPNHGPIFLARYTSGGTLLWAKNFGGPGGGYALAPDGSGGVYVTGAFSGADVDFDPGANVFPLSTALSDMFIAHFDAGGNLLDAISVGGTSSSWGRGIAPDGSGGVFVTGSYSDADSDFDPGAGIVSLPYSGEYDLFVARYFSNLDLAWAFGVGSLNSDWGSAIVADGFGGAILTGTYRGTPDFDPDPIAVNTLPNSGNAHQIVVARYNDAGQHIWAHGIGDTGGDFGNALTSIGTDVIVTGVFGGSVEFDPGTGTVILDDTYGAVFAARYDVNGTLAWAFNVSGGGDRGRGVAPDGAGGFFLAGGFVSASADFAPGALQQVTPLSAAGGFYEGFLAHYDVNNNLLWAGQIGGPNHDEFTGITDDGSGGVFATGYFNETADFGLTNVPVGLTSQGMADLLFAHYESSGELPVCSGQPDVFVVMVSSDDGACSLRHALNYTNAHPNGGTPDQIVFGISPTGSAKTITPKTPLPAITDAVTVNGLTQGCPGGAPCVELDGFMASSASGLTITGPGSTIQGLVINAYFGNGGIVIDGSGAMNNVIRRNHIGTDFDGIVADGNLYGIEIKGGASNNLIGGKLGSDSNVISGNLQNGVTISGSSTSNNVASGNLIGVSASGFADLGNSQNGVRITGGAFQNVIGGNANGDGNVISGNSQNGVAIVGAGSNNRVEGNLIGLNVTGNSALGNTLHGVLIDGTSNTIVGGTVGSALNVISGHGETGGISTGVVITGSTTSNNQIIANRIGTDANATMGIPNTYGVYLQDGAHDNVIGGVNAGNTISGNGTGIGIVAAGSNNRIEGNRIGTSPDGSQALGSQFWGIRTISSNGTYLGGTDPGEGNVISGHGVGIYLGIDADGNHLEGNRIGVDLTGTSPIPNTIGVFVEDGASENIIGGTTGVAADGPCIGACNVIMNNTGRGITIVDESLGNSIRANSIFQNGSLGIDLVSDGITQNDGTDIDTGPNDLQNFPEMGMTFYFTSSQTLQVNGTVPGAANNDVLLIDFYRSDGCDDSAPNDFGEGKTYIGTKQLVVMGTPDFQATFSLSTPLSSTEVITSTATNEAGSTSEFSKCVVPTPMMTMSLSLKTKFQGPFIEGVMTNVLNSGGYLDLQPWVPFVGVGPSPFIPDPRPIGPDPTPIGPDPTPLGPEPTPFGPDPTPLVDVNGNGRIDFFETHPDIVDWILIKILAGDPQRPPMEVLGETAAFLLQDGTIIDLNGGGPITVHIPARTRVGQDACYVAVGHRNHLMVMGHALDCSGGEIAYDFTTGPDQAFGTGAMVDLGDGTYGLYAGDANGDGMVDQADLAEWQRRAGASGYEGADLNLDGNVFNNDLLNLWRSNLGKSSQVPAH